jgi:hypothetical protein
MRELDTEQEFQDLFGGFLSCTSFVNNDGGQFKQEDPSFKRLPDASVECYYSANSGSTCDYKGSSDRARLCYCVALPPTPAPSAKPSSAPATAVEDCFSDITIWNLLFQWLICFIKTIFNNVF